MFEQMQRKHREDTARCMAIDGVDAHTRNIIDRSLRLDEYTDGAAKVSRAWHFLGPCAYRYRRKGEYQVRIGTVAVEAEDVVRVDDRREAADAIADWFERQWAARFGVEAHHDTAAQDGPEPSM